MDLKSLDTATLKAYRDMALEDAREFGPGLSEIRQRDAKMYQAEIDRRE